MRERVQKLISRAGLASRRTAERWIEEGRVQINGVTAQLGAQADPKTDHVVVNGKQLKPVTEKLTVLLNKPRGYVTTMKDPQGRKKVTDLITDIPQRLFPIGRLDYNTEGLLLLTNDGDLSQGLSHPRHHVEKIYLVKARGVLTAEMRKRLEQGVELDDGITAPAKVKNYRVTGSGCWFELSIHEGRNRQVRRMCEALDLTVVRLKRIRLAMLDLSGVPSGRYRVLTPDEIRLLRKSI
ncbi:MAG: pseudouridine synthase [Desulfuromonas sp.]|nr:MAG: pseudouridine synthase [Desulfuromonas sp.]